MNGGKCCTLAARSSHCWSVKVSDPRRNASKAALHWCHSATVCIFCTLSYAACKQTLLCHSPHAFKIPWSSNPGTPSLGFNWFSKLLCFVFFLHDLYLKLKRPLQWPDSSQQPSQRSAIRTTPTSWKLKNKNKSEETSNKQWHITKIQQDQWPGKSSNLQLLKLDIQRPEAN